MIARRQGGVLNVTSVGAYVVPGPNQAAYYASKAYVLSLTEAIATAKSPATVFASRHWHRVRSKPDFITTWARRIPSIA